MHAVPQHDVLAALAAIGTVASGAAYCLLHRLFQEILDRELGLEDVVEQA